jgi:hypothetical protein
MLYLHLPIGTMHLAADRNDFGIPNTSPASHEVSRKPAWECVYRARRQQRDATGGAPASP